MVLEGSCGSTWGYGFLERFTATVFISAVGCMAEASIFAVELQEATAKLPVI